MVCPTEDAGQTEMKGCIHLYTGDGKGKTTAALGLALRAAGAGIRVYIAQFLKGKRYSEDKALAHLRPAAPTSTPTPTPEVCSCREVALGGAPGDAVPRGFVRRVGLYPGDPSPPPSTSTASSLAPAGGRSLTPNGELVDGIRPAARGYANAGLLLQSVPHTACTGLTPGTYSMCLGLMPAGAPPDNAESPGSRLGVRHRALTAGGARIRSRAGGLSGGSPPPRRPAPRRRAIRHDAASPRGARTGTFNAAFDCARKS